jgi:hypothetical protein
VQHDLDSVFGMGQNPGSVSADIFLAANIPTINRFIKHPQFVPRYYYHLKDLIETTFSPEQMNPFLDEVLGGFVPPSRIQQMKDFVVQRNAYILSHIPSSFTVDSNLPMVGGYHQTTVNTCTLSGTAGAIKTRSVLVNGELASWLPVDGQWSISSTALNPGINRIIVQTFDGPNGSGNEIDNGHIDIWYNDGGTSDISGTVAVSRTLDAVSGPWHVTGDITVPTGVTLTIQPATTLFFDAGAGIIVTAGGRLVAEGTEYGHIRLTSVPGGAHWDGVKFDHTLTDNRLTYVDHEFGDGQGKSTDVQYSRVTIEHVVWSGTSTEILNIDHPSVICRNSVFPSIGSTEPLHGVGLSGSEYLIFDGCTFGSATGYNDIIDFTGGRRPGPIFQLYNSTFLGGGDDGPDLDSTDAHIEGCIFMNFAHQAGSDGASSAVATGSEGFSSEIYVARNIFLNNEHGILLKEDCGVHAHNNIFMNTSIGVITFGEPYRDPPREPGGSAIMAGNIFWDNTETFEWFFQEPLPDYGPTGEVIVDYSSLPSPWHYLGVGNIDADPLFVDEPGGDFRLKSDSGAVGTGAWGLDMGAMVPAGAAISGEPPAVTYHTDATLTVGGPGIISYKYSVNSPTGPWSGEASVDVPVALTGLTNGQSYTVYAIGKNSAYVWQSEETAAVSHTWTIDTSHCELVINEVLAHTHGNDPDIIELYYDGPGPINLAGMSLSDNSNDPDKFVFSSANVFTTIMNPGDYMVLYGDLNTGVRNHTGFGLLADGEALYLYDKAKPDGSRDLIDSVEFGPQINEFSIGRVGWERSWRLNRMTFGMANIVQPLGDPDTLKINEWLANGQVLFDDDFIELYNPHSLPVALDGMYLTDNPITQPGKHRIVPLSFVSPQGYTVFRANDGNEPSEVDFKLSADGEMIGLFDGELNMIDQVLYGPQTTDVSQGRAPDGAHNFEFFVLPSPGITNTIGITPPTTVTFVPSGATAYYYVPPDASWENTWMYPDFNGLAGWKSSPTALGFGYGGKSIVAYNDCVYRSTDQYIAANVTTYGIGSGYSGPTSGPLLNQATGEDAGVTATLTQGGGVTWQPSPASGGNDCAVGTDAYNTFSGIADMTGVIYYGSAGWWIDLVFTGLDPATEYTFATSSARCAYANRLTTYTLGGADTYYNASTLGVDVLAENRIRFNTGDNYSEGYVARWTGITAADGSFTVRAEADPGGEDGRRAYSFDVFMLEGGFKGSDLQGKMQGVNASLWSRIDFDVEDPSVFNKLTLRMKYEDGFVAYLNGVEVVRDNLSGTPMWNSQADGNRQDELALQFIDFDISSHISDLRQGHNVLAIHGLNDNVDDPNFLILPELVAVSESGLSIYERALILLDGLRITEIMYHSPSGSNFDYIELQNISDKTLNLDGVQFLEGVEFVFPNMELEAGEYVVVASNLAAFRSMYGMGPSVAGVYSGGLSGGGEDIVLTLAWPLDAAIMRFGYSDRWYPTTDGGGQSLHIIDATAHPATWDKAASWRPAAPTPAAP